MKLLPRLTLLTRLVLCSAIAAPALILPSAALAQAPGAPAALPLDQQDMQTAGQMVDANDLKGAASLYEGIPVKYPTSVLIPQSKVRLGYVYFRLTEYDKAVKSLQEAAAIKGVVPEIIELAQSLIPQVLSAKAATFKPGVPARKLTFEEAVKNFDIFLKNFPRSDEVETANYGKAVAHYQLEQYPLAMQALKTNLTTFPTSQTVLDSQFLLALTMGTVANVGAKAAEKKDPAVEGNYDNAEKMLADVVNKGAVQDVALANDARFQIGEMLFTRAGFSKDDAASNAFFQRALDGYRLVQSKEVVVAAQKNRIERLKAMRVPAMQARDVNLLKRLGRIIEREQEKLATIEGRPEATLSAKIKMGEIFYRLEQYDEARVMLNYVKPLVEDEEQKKEISYYTAVSLAAQNGHAKGEKADKASTALAERTEAAYTEFQTAYKNDPIGENLAVVLGASFVDKNPEKAVKYLQEQLVNYPKSSLNIAAQAQMATAYERMGNDDEAVKMFKETLAKNPAKEIAAAADFGIATILKKTGKVPEALAQFKSVREKYAGTAQAEQAAYHLGQLTLESGDAKTAAAELQTFIKNYPKSVLMPEALFFLGQAQKGQNMNAEAMATYKQVGEAHPKSQVAPYSYFERAKLLMADTKSDETVALMRGFIKAYPDSEQLYQAYDFIAQIQSSAKKEADAVATYEEFVKSKPEDPKASVALLRIGTIWKDEAEKIGRYSTLNEEQRKTWTTNMDASVNACERLLRAYPESSEVALALNMVLDVQKARVAAKLIGDADVEKYFQGLANEFKDKAATKSKIIFTLAANLFEKDKAKAVQLMAGVYDPAQKYAPEDLDLYSSALVDQKKYDEAEKIFNKLAEDYPVPKNTEPGKAATMIQIAQSTSLFGIGKVLQERGKVEEAKAKFDELEKVYGWSPKMLEANYGIALSLFEQKSYDEALKRLSGVIRASKAPAELRAKAMLLLARIHEEMKNYDDAVSNYAKISTFYSSVPGISSEGLWRAAQILEKQSKNEIPIATPVPKATPVKKAAAAPAKKK